MDNQNQCMGIKQAKLIVNAHKHNLLNSLCNNGYVYFKQQENNNNKKSVKNQGVGGGGVGGQTRQTDRQTNREREMTLHATLLFHEHSMR